MKIDSDLPQSAKKERQRAIVVIFIVGWAVLFIVAATAIMAVRTEKETAPEPLPEGGGVIIKPE